MQRVFAYQFARIHALYVQKAERKGRTKQEVDQIICWLTGYTPAGLQKQIKGDNDLAKGRPMAKILRQDV